jgi:hypothetical protein
MQRVMWKIYASRIKQLGPRYIARAAIALAAILVWGIFSLSFALGLQQQRAAPQPQAPALTPVATTGATGEQQYPVSVTYPELLEKARGMCPEDRPFILVDDDGAVSQMTDYLLYPRKIEYIQTKVPFEASNLANSAGGCAANYGPGTARRLDPYVARLERIVCAADGCLYSIK